VASAVLYAAGVSFLGMLILDLGFGALAGHFPGVFAIGAFGALTFVLFALACQEMAGIAGTGLAAFLFLFIGVGANGSTTAAPLLPAVYRQISPWTPNGAITRAVRTVTYFHGYGIGQPLLALAIWSAAALVLIAGNDLLRATERRVPSADAPSIYATSGIALVTGKLKRREQVEATPVTHS
jgi:hypothetical protein